MTKLTTKQPTDGLLHRFLAPALEQSPTADAVGWHEGGSCGGCNWFAQQDRQDSGALPTQSQKKGYLGLPSITE